MKDRTPEAIFGPNPDFRPSPKFPRRPLTGYKLCKECGQPMLKKGQTRQHPDDYRHASGCPLDDDERDKPKGEHDA